MVTILPKETDWADAFSQIGKGVSQGYTDRADEMALQKAIGGLKPEASPREILDAITGTRTYGSAAKQNVIKNYMGNAEFEETLRAAKKREEQRDKELQIAENKAVKASKQVATDEQLRAGLQTVKEMREIGKRGNLGWGTGVRKLYSDDAAKDAGKYEQLGKSLIALSTTIPVRNRVEFETLAEKLYDPGFRDAEREGTLEAMENILNRSILDNSSESQSSQQTPEGKVRVKDKKTGKTGTVTPFEGMDEKYERL